jgi:hypothetical protein
MTFLKMTYKGSKHVAGLSEENEFLFMVTCGISRIKQTYNVASLLHRIWLISDFITTF